MAQTANQDPASIMFNWAAQVRRATKRKRRLICWIAQLFDLREPSTCFLLKKKKKRKYESQAFATQAANNAGGVQLLGEGKAREGNEAPRPHPPEPRIGPCVCRTHAAVVGRPPALQTRMVSPASGGCLRGEPSVRLHGLAPECQSRSAYGMSHTAEHYLPASRSSLIPPSLWSCNAAPPELVSPCATVLSHIEMHGDSHAITEGVGLLAVGSRQPREPCAGKPGVRCESEAAVKLDWKGKQSSFCFFFFFSDYG